VTAAGSCKWTTALMDVSEYAALQADLMRAGFGGGETALFLFSRLGFTDRLRSLAASQKPPRVFLIGLPGLYAV